MVFDGVVSAPFQQFGDLSPAVAHSPVCQEKDPLFPVSPLVFVYVGTQMVVPSLAALLADASWVISLVPGRC